LRDDQVCPRAADSRIASRSGRGSTRGRHARSSSTASVAAAQHARLLLHECRRRLPSAHRRRRMADRVCTDTGAGAPTWPRRGVRSCLRRGWRARAASARRCHRARACRRRRVVGRRWRRTSWRAADPDASRGRIGRLVARFSYPLARRTECRPARTSAIAPGAPLATTASSACWSLRGPGGGARRSPSRLSSQLSSQRRGWRARAHLCARTWHVALGGVAPSSGPL